MTKIESFLWFDRDAEGAVAFYVETFGDAEVVSINHFGRGTPEFDGRVTTITFRIHDQHFTALNGGPNYALTPAFSLMVHCETQQEIDRYWTRLAEGGTKLRCGWVTDRWGLTWQIIPARLHELIGGPPERSQRVMDTLLKMEKIDVATLERAFNAK
jgi:predicted 3-demethylubiquinone-9 3-methyltransferase (glyoxalase superfamily)